MKNIPVYLINLDTDKDRLEFMDDQLKTLGIEYERFPAIRGTALPDWLKPYFLDEVGAISSRLTPGEVGCYASHLAVMKRVADGDRPALVFEDDVRIKPGFPALIDEFLSSGPTCDVLRLSCPRRNRLAITKASFSGGYKAIRYYRAPVNMGAYLITPAGARKFLDWKTLRISPVDHDIKKVWLNKLDMLGIAPEPVAHNAFGDSSINAIEVRSARWGGSRFSRASDGAKRLLHFIQMELV